MLNTGDEGNDDHTSKEREEMSRLIDETANGILRIYDEFGAAAVEEWEVNELLDWTHNLNYDDYQAEWRTLGTTVSSNDVTGKRNHLFYRSRLFDSSKLNLLDIARFVTLMNEPIPV
jgi:hypothetical protein